MCYASMTAVAREQGWARELTVEDWRWLLNCHVMGHDYVRHVAALLQDGLLHAMMHA